MDDGTTELNSSSRKELREIVDRIERLAEEQKALAGDMKDLYLEAKGRGYDAKALKKVVALRKMDEAERNEMEAILDVYKHALGMLEGTPLGDHAIARVGPKSLKTEVGETLDRVFGKENVQRDRRVEAAE